MEMLEREKQRIEDERIARREVEEEKQEDDYMGTERSCCICFRINTGVHLIGLATILQLAFLVFQIYNVTNDGSMINKDVSPQYYYVSYFCLIPFYFSIYVYVT